MALSLLLRGAAHSCKVGPVLRIPSKYNSIISAAYSNLARIQNDRHLPAVHNQPAIKLSSAVREFATKAAKPVKHGDHTKMWTIEKVVSGALVGILPLGIMFPNILFDLVMAVGIVMHTHWGLEAIAHDYARASVVGVVVSKGAVALVYFLSVLILVGLFNVIFNNIGLGNSVRQVWKI